jgi:hypothetical protein
MTRSCVAGLSLFVAAGCSRAAPGTSGKRASAADAGGQVQAPPTGGDASAEVVVLGDEPERACVRPVFSTSDGEVAAGTAFVVTMRGKQYLFTAHHLFGVAGGLDRDYAWSEMRERVSGVKGESTFEDISVSGGAPFEIAGARALDKSFSGADVAIFPVAQGSRVHALSLSSSLPSTGQKVWMIGEVMGARELRHAAIVEEASDGGVLYRFETRVELRATSGAPVVDEHGRVVAMNLGGGEHEGIVYGIGNPATAMARMAETAIRAKH